MNHLLSISRLKRRFGRFRLLILMGVLFAVAVFAGHYFGNRTTLQEQALLQSQQVRLDNLYTLSEQLNQQINFLKVELEIEKQAGTHVKEQLQQLHQESFKLQKELAFYQKIMAPELAADGVEIDEFHISPSGSERVYHYKLVLVQTQKQRRFAKGQVKLTLSGSIENRSQSYPLDQLIGEFTPKQWQFSFRYFKIIEGDFTLPEGFSPQRVHIQVRLPANKWQKASDLERQFRFYPDQAF